jgi:hypothetical protein
LVRVNALDAVDALVQRMLTSRSSHWTKWWPALCNNSPLGSDLALAGEHTP